MASISLNQNLQLIFPLGIKFVNGNRKKRISSHVLIDGITPDFVKQEHCHSESSRLQSDDSIDGNVAIMRRNTVKIFNTFNLYIAIFNNDDLTSNVQIVKNMIIDYLNILIQKRQHDIPNTDISSSGEGNVSKKIKKRIDPVTSAATSHNQENTIELDFQLLCENFKVSISSLYDWGDDMNVGDSSAHIPYLAQKFAEAVGGSLPINLYVCSFYERYLFTKTLEMLLENNQNHWFIYRVPVCQDDETHRFTFDMFWANRKRLREIEIAEQRKNLIKMYGDNIENSTFYFNSLLANMASSSSSSLAPSVSNSNNSRGGECVETLYRQFINDLNLFYKTHGTIKNYMGNDQFNNGHMNADGDVESSNSSCTDIYSTFSLGEWCIYRKFDYLIYRIDENTFFNLMNDTFPSILTQIQNVDFSYDPMISGNLTNKGGTIEKIVKIISQMYNTPMIFVPFLIWDIETVANNVSTIPRGVKPDEKIVSVAVTMQKEKSFIMSIVWVLVPKLINQHYPSEMEIIENLKFNFHRKFGNEKYTEPLVRCFTDEKSLLCDFCISMFSQFPLLNHFYNIDTSNFHLYADICNFLVGHNSVCYDFSFILNRCLFFDLAFLTQLLNGGLDINDNQIMKNFTFTRNQICVDTMLFLTQRMRHLTNFDLSSVLHTYKCEITKDNLDARDIRFFYHAFESLETLGKSRFNTRENRVEYFFKFLQYNLIDCLSLGNLINKLSFTHYITTMMKFFHTAFDTVCYRGNSKLLPNLFIQDLMQQNSELLVFRPPRASVVSVDSNIQYFKDLIQKMKDIFEEGNFKFSVDVKINKFENIDKMVDWQNYRGNFFSTNMINNFNPLLKFFQYIRGYVGGVALTNSHINTQLCDIENRAIEDKVDIQPVDGFSNTNYNERILHTIDLKRLIFSSDMEIDLLKIGKKTYIGGLNYANACQVKHPICMDYNSFYPSIIRHYNLDMNNVAVFTVLKLLLLIRPYEFLEQIIRDKRIRIFDYTSIDGVEAFVNMSIFEDEKYRQLYEPPCSYVPRKWYEGIEITSLPLLIASSKTFYRKVLVILTKPNGSAIARVVSSALERRKKWKEMRKVDPTDKILESRELMEKLIANGTYGYTNFSSSVIFSRATAAAVTLLCRNTFNRTRFIIESREFLTRLALNPDHYYIKINYIDTDGCIASMHRRDNRADLLELIDQESDHLPRENVGLCINRPHFINPTITKMVYKEFIKTNIEYKKKFVDIINEMLNMNHVTLAPEEEKSISVSVFGRKKYVLFKLTNDFGKFELKKRGFELNAPKPIKIIYDLILQNMLHINNTLGFVREERFVCKVVRHREILYGIFDCLYDMWRRVIRPTNGTIQDLRYIDFTTKIPLNIRETEGKLSDFIKKTLSVNQYDDGDRVRVLKVLNISDTYIMNRKFLKDCHGNVLVLYDCNDWNLILADEALEHLDDYLPDFRNFLGGHLTYMYQCIEGQQTLRTGDDFEAILWSSEDVENIYFENNRKNKNNDELSENVLYLKTMKAICSFWYANWIWDRILIAKHKNVHGDKYWAFSWRDNFSLNSPAIGKLEKILENVSLSDRVVEDRALPLKNYNQMMKRYTPPTLITGNFRKHWNIGDNDCDPIINYIFFDRKNHHNFDTRKVKQFLMKQFVIYKPK